VCKGTGEGGSPHLLKGERGLLIGSEGDFGLGNPYSNPGDRDGEMAFLRTKNSEISLGE